jgi:hypothetical protein
MNRDDEQQYWLYVNTKKGHDQQKRDKLREELDIATKEFMKKGGVVRQIPIGESSLAEDNRVAHYWIED